MLFSDYSSNINAYNALLHVLCMYTTTIIFLCMTGTRRSETFLHLLVLPDCELWKVEVYCVYSKLKCDCSDFSNSLYFSDIKKQRFVQSLENVHMCSSNIFSSFLSCQRHMIIGFVALYHVYWISVHHIYMHYQPLSPSFSLPFPSLSLALTLSLAHSFPFIRVKQLHVASPLC